MHGISEKHVWNIHRICMEYVSNMYGRFTEYVWNMNMYGICIVYL